MQKWFQTHGTTLSLAILTALMFLVTQPSDAPEVLATCLLILICGGVILLVRVMGQGTSKDMTDDARLFIVSKGKVVNRRKAVERFLTWRYYFVSAAGLRPSASLAEGAPGFRFAKAGAFTANPQQAAWSSICSRHCRRFSGQTSCRGHRED